MPASSHRSGRLIIFVGPAGAGKTTLAHRLINAQPTHRGFSVSHTTRPIRPTETDATDYHFITRSRFETMIAADAFLEWAQVHDNLYGTARVDVQRHLAQGRDLFFDIDIQGAMNLYAQLPERTLLIFIIPPSWQVLGARLEGRGSETETTLRRRLRTARDELRAVADSPLPWRLIINDQIHVAQQALEVVLTAPSSATPAVLTSDPEFSANSLILREMCADAEVDPRASLPPALDP